MERKTVSGLLILLIVLAVFNLGLSPSVPFEDGAYLELEKQFEKRTAMLEAEQNQLMEQYYPDKKDALRPAVLDTLPADSSADGENSEGEEQGETKRIDINRANSAALESLPGIGPTYAQRIIEYRKAHGGFESIEELKQIKGIAEKRLDNLKPFIKLTDPQ